MPPLSHKTVFFYFFSSSSSFGPSDFDELKAGTDGTDASDVATEEGPFAGAPDSGDGGEEETGGDDMSGEDDTADMQDPGDSMSEQDMDNEGDGTRDFDPTTASAEGGEGDTGDGRSCGTGCKAGATVGTLGGLAALGLFAGGRLKKKDEDEEDEDEGAAADAAAAKAEEGVASDAMPPDSSLPIDVNDAFTSA